MAKEFNAKDFLGKVSYPSIQVGEHNVTLGKVTVGNDVKDGEDNVYIILPIVFDNGRTVPVRFYREGIQIVHDQLRKQTEDRNTYETNLMFFENLEGKSVKCWISWRNYTDKNDNKKRTLQYDFIYKTKTTDGAEIGEDDGVELIV